MVLVVAAREILPAKNQQAGPAFLPSCRGRASCQTCVSLQWMLKQFPSPLWARAFGRYHRIVDRLIGRVCHGGSPDGCLLGKLAWYRCEVGFVVPLDSSRAPVAIEAFRVVSEQIKPICTRYQQYQQTWP